MTKKEEDESVRQVLPLQKVDVAPKRHWEYIEAAFNPWPVPKYANGKTHVKVGPERGLRKKMWQRSSVRLTCIQIKIVYCIHYKNIIRNK